MNKHNNDQIVVSLSIRTNGKRPNIKIVNTMILIITSVRSVIDVSDVLSRIVSIFCDLNYDIRWSKYQVQA